MKKKIILSSLMAIVVCISLIVGATFALFTSTSEVNVAVTAGKVKVIATAGDLALTSRGIATSPAFVNGGTAVKADNTVTLTNITPGDKVTFDITVANESNVATKYRTIVKRTADDGLFAGLKITINGLVFDGQDAYTNWEDLAVGSADEVISVSVELPYTSDLQNIYQEKTCSISYIVEAVQGNADTVDYVKAVAPVAATAITAGALNEAIIIPAAAQDDPAATLPAGVKLAAGTDELTLEIKYDVANTGNFTFTGATALAVDIDIPEVADDNETPIRITLPALIIPGLTDLEMYHDGILMTPVAQLADVDAHNEYYYDPASGDVTVATKSFSNFTALYNKEDIVVNYDYRINDDNTIEIGSVNGLLWLAQQTRTVLDNNTVKLTADIDMTGIDWTPITGFNGTFDGQNHTISNLTVNVMDQQGTEYMAGFFGFAAANDIPNLGAFTIQNLTIDSADITGFHHVGVIAGYLTDCTTVSNCHVTNSKVHGIAHSTNGEDGNKVGGISGYMNANSLIENCTVVNTAIDAGRDAGKIVGAGHTAVVTGCSATNVTVTANGSGSGANIALGEDGLIGRVLS